MSFILDALKKSEAERKRQDAPGIASIPTQTARRSGSKWIWIIAALLVVNLAFLAGIVMKPAADEADRSRAQPAVPDPIPTLPVTPPVSLPAGDAGPVAAGPAPSTPAEAAAAAEVADAAPPVQAPPADALPSAGLPTFEELRASGRLQLPDLHIDIHVYSGQPADRFVFVNMTKYREKARLAEGPVISRITPDGVVLDYLGTAFLLPRE